MRPSIAILAAVVGLSACTTPLPVPNYRLAQGDRVGIIVDVGDTLFYTMSGASSRKSSGSRTSDKRYSSDWGLGRYITERLSDELRKGRGFDVVDLYSHGISYYRLAGLIVARDGKWAVRPSRRQMYDRLVRELRLKAVVVVAEKRMYVTSKCTKSGCANYYSVGHGLVRVTGVLANKYYAVAAYQTDIFILNPPANPALGRAFKELERRRVGRIRRFAPLKDPRNISAAEWRPVTAHLRGYVNRLAVLVSRTLRR